MKTLDLQRLLSRFDEKELKVLANYLAAFNGTFGEHHQTKLSRLLELLLVKGISEEEMMRDLGIEGDAFRKLKDRLRDKAFDSLLLDVNLKRSGSFPPSFKSFIDAKQDYVKARIALKKGLDKEAWKFINKGIRKAQKFEVYSDLLELLYLKQRFVNLRSGKSAFDKVEKDILHYEQCRLAYHKAARYAELLHQRVGFNNSKQENKRFLEQCMKEMQQGYKLSNSPFIKQKLLLFQMQYHEEEQHFEDCLEVAMETVDFLKTKKELATNQALGSAYLNAFRYQIIVERYALAQKTFEECLQFFAQNTYAYSYTLELAFYLAFYQGNYGQSLEVMENLLNTYAGSSYQQEKWTYLKACACFQLGDFKSANRLLAKQCSALEKDKEGWGAFLYVLQVMTHLERKQYDLADASVDQLHYLLKSKQPKARLKAIYKLLLLLKKEGYQYKELQGHRLLKRLSSNKAWHVKRNMEPELVWFDDWLNSKL